MKGPRTLTWNLNEAVRANGGPCASSGVHVAVCIH